MSFKDQLHSGKFVVTAELHPPKGTDLSELYEYAERWRQRLDAIMVPDLQNGIMRLGSLSTCALLKRKGIEAIYHLSCANRNRLALQSELLNAAVLGLENLLLLGGEPPSIGDHFDAKPVFDLDVMGLLGAAKRLQEGSDLVGNELKGKPVFFVGTQVNASAQGSQLDLEMKNMEKKIHEGSHFFIAGSVYDPGLLENFMKKAAPFKIPVIVGITLLKSVGMARYISKHVEGAIIPEAILDRLLKASDKQQACIDIAADLIRAVKPFCQGVQIIPLGWEHLLPALLDRVGL